MVEREGDDGERDMVEGKRERWNKNTYKAF